MPGSRSGSETHKFDRAMQASAFAHLDRWLRVPTT
jgi:hypothetical protein